MNLLSSNVEINAPVAKAKQAKADGAKKTPTAVLVKISKKGKELEPYVSECRFTSYTKKFFVNLLKCLSKNKQIENLGDFVLDITCQNADKKACTLAAQSLAEFTEIDSKDKSNYQVILSKLEMASRIKASRGSSKGTQNTNSEPSVQEKFSAAMPFYEAFVRSITGGAPKGKHNIIVLPFEHDDKVGLSLENALANVLLFIIFVSSMFGMTKNNGAVGYLNVLSDAIDTTQASGMANFHAYATDSRYINIKKCYDVLRQGRSKDSDILLHALIEKLMNIKDNEYAAIIADQSKIDERFLEFAKNVARELSTTSTKGGNQSVRFHVEKEKLDDIDFMLIKFIQ